MNAAAAEWEPPVPLTRDVIAPFPVHVLPTKLGEFVRELARFSETDVALSGALVLGAVAAAIAGKVKIEPKPGYQEPLNIMLLVSLRPGERKSSVLRRVFRPIERFEKRLQEERKGFVEEVTRRRDELRDRIRSIRRARGSDAPPSSGEEALRAELDALPQAALPRLLADDTTPECIAPLMEANGGRLCVASAEGGIVAILGGRYSQGIPNIDVFLKGHAGDAIRVDRRNAESIVIHEPALTVALAVQPDVVSELLAQKQFRGRGLVARFLFALPTPRAGTRNYDPADVAEPISNEYDGTIDRLLALPTRDPPPVLRFSDDARAAWLSFAVDVDSKCGEDGELAVIVDWVSKLPGATARLAGNLHMAEHAWQDDAFQRLITLATIERAIVLARYFLESARVVLGATPPDERTKSAEALLRWIRGRPSFTVRMVQRSLAARFPTSNDVRDAVAILEEHGYVRERIPERSPGRPPNEYDVHPDVAADETSNKRERREDPPSG